LTEPQNIYDQPEFFAGYSSMERFGDGWSKALEQPFFLDLLPDVTGMRVLDLGCGAGQLSYHLAASGAEEVIAVDISETMLDLARARRSHPRVSYQRADIEALRFPAECFDLTVSSLALHYVADYRGLLRRIAEWLKPGGVLVASMEHPIYTGRLPGEGWVVDERGEFRGWQIDNYFVEGLRTERWFVDGVQKYHRTVSTLLDGVLQAGLRLDRMIEPVPDDTRLASRPHEAENLRRPMFLLLRESVPPG